MASPNTDINKGMIERGYWVAVHRLSIMKWATISLYCVIGFVYILFFIQFGLYVYSYNDWQRFAGMSVQPMLDWKAAEEANKPLDIEFGPVQVFALGGNRYDLVVAAKNPNTSLALGSFSYQFTVDNGRHVNGTNFLLPGDQKFITVLGYRPATPITNKATFAASDYHWEKLNRLPALSWLFTDQPAYSAKQIIVQGGKQVVIPAKISWTVKNGSTLNIRTVLWQVALYSGTTLAAVYEETGSNFVFLDERPFELYLYEDLPRIDTVQVNPIVNIFDPQFSYLR